MRLMYLAMSFMSFSIPGMMSENRGCSGSMSFLLIYIYIYCIYVYIWILVYVHVYMNIFSFGASFPLHSYMYIHISKYIYIYCLICNYDWIVLASIRLIYMNARFSAQFLMQLLMLCVFFRAPFLKISFLLKHVQTWISMHESFMKTPKKAVWVMYMAQSGSPQNPMSEMMIPLSSKVLVDGFYVVQSQTSFFPRDHKPSFWAYCGMPPKVLDTVPYSDSMTFSLLTSLCMISGRSPDQAVEALGHHLIVFSLRCGHGRFLKAQGATLPIFLQTLGCIMESAQSWRIRGSAHSCFIGQKQNGRSCFRTFVHV